jgi:hypothetical protein
MIPQMTGTQGSIYFEEEEFRISWKNPKDALISKCHQSMDSE